MATVILLTGPGGPWLEASSFSRDFWSSRQARRLDSKRDMALPIPALPPYSFIKKEGVVTNSFRPFDTKSPIGKSGTTKIPLIIHFQEIHGNVIGQNNLSDALKRISKQIDHKPLLVAVEGASGPLNTESFRTFPDVAFRNTLARLFLQTGWMTGEEFLASTADTPDFQVVGVEDPTLFRENRLARDSTVTNRHRMGGILGAYSTLISPLNAKAFPPALRRLTLLREHFDAGRLDVEEYVKGLTSSGLTPWASAAFPSLSKLLETSQMEKRPDIVQARLRLVKTTNPSSAQSRADPLELQDVRLLSALASQSSSLNSEHIQQDLSRLEERQIAETVKCLPSPEKQRTEDLLRLNRWLQLNQHLWSLDMTPDDWERFQVLKRQMNWAFFHEELLRLCRLHGVAPPPQRLTERLMCLDRETGDRLEDFYRLAHRRDREMAARAVALARTEGQGFAALVTGGFHSPGVRRWLRWAPANYIEILPRFTEGGAPHTLRDASRFQLDENRVSIPSLTEAFTLLHFPQHRAQIRERAPRAMIFYRIIESEGARRLAGLAPGRDGPIPFLLGGTPESPTLIEGRGPLRLLRESLPAQKPLGQALDILLSPHPRRAALGFVFTRGTNWFVKTARSLLETFRAIVPSGMSPFQFRLINGSLFDACFVGAGGLLFCFIPLQNGSSQGNLPSGNTGPEGLMKEALAMIQRGSFPEAEKFLRRLHAVDLDDHWSDELFRQLSQDQRSRAVKELSTQAWSAALNGHFTRLFEEHAYFLTEQYRTATAFLAGQGRRMDAMREHLQNAKNTLSIFDLNARTPDIPTDAPRGAEALKHNQSQSDRSSRDASWGWFCGEFERMINKSDFDINDEKYMVKLLEFERKWLAGRLRSYLHPSLVQGQPAARWLGDDFLLPSVYGEFRHIADLAPEKATSLQSRFEARRQCARDRARGVLTDITGEPLDRPVNKDLLSAPALTTAIDAAFENLAPGEGTVRIQYPWPQTKAPFEQALANRLRQGNDRWGPRKLWRINTGQIMGPSNETRDFSTRLADLLVSLGKGGGNAVLLDVSEFDDLFWDTPNALADAVKKLRRIEEERGIPGPERTLVFFLGQMGSRNPMASREGAPPPISSIEASPTLAHSLLQSRVDRLNTGGVGCAPEILPRLESAIAAGDMDLTTADGILERSGARARARSGTGAARVENIDLDLEQQGLPAFEHLSLARQAGIAVHSMATEAATELQQYLNELRRTTTDDPNFSPLLAFIRRILALRFLWPRTPIATQDRRWGRTEEEQASLLKQWRERRRTFRDELDRSISGQNDLKAQLERIYLLHDFEQWGNPSPVAADMVLLVGPPGTGKTTIGEALAKALGRKFIEINAGGTADPNRWKGIKRTFVGSQPSEITRQLEEAGTEDVLILIDEVGKMSREALDALTDFLDKRQEYHDINLGSRLRYRRARVRILLTTNEDDLAVIPDHILSRMVLWLTRRYTDKELIAIGLDNVFPEKLKLTHFGENRVTVPDKLAVTQTLVSEYLPGKDVRDFQKFLQLLLTQAYHEGLIASQPGRPAPPVVVDPAFVRRVLGASPTALDSIPSHDVVGQVNGLAAGALGGIVIPVQAFYRPLPSEEENELIVTGLMKSDMADSAQRAILTVQQALGVEGEHGRTHFHIPGEFPKSGPSAGLAFLTALYSERTGWPVRADVAMTGEISPSGKAQRIGGLDEKLSAALRAGVKTVFLPEANGPELREALARHEHLRALTCVLVHHSYEVLNAAIVRPAGEPPLQVPPSTTGVLPRALPEPPQSQSLPGKTENPTDTDKPAPPDTPNRPSPPPLDEVQRLVFHCTPQERTAALQRLFATGQDNDARRVLEVLHVLASISDPSFVDTLKDLPSWKERLSVVAQRNNLQELGVLMARAREAVVKKELDLFKESLGSFTQWVNAPPTQAGECLRQTRIRWTNQRQRAIQFQGGFEPMSTEFLFMEHMSAFLTQLLNDLPPDSSDLSSDDARKFQKTLANYLAFFQHQFKDFSVRELPLVTTISNVVQENALLNWIAVSEHDRPTADVAVTALAAQGEMGLRAKRQAGDLTDLTPALVSAPVTEAETETFRSATEELARRLATNESRSSMFFSPDSALSVRFLRTAARYFQQGSPFPNQRSLRILSFPFPETVGDPERLTMRLQETISQARAAGDVVLAIDLDAFSRHFKYNLATPMAVILNTASAQGGPLGGLAAAPLLFFGNEETHLAMSDASYPYDLAVQGHPVLPSQPGAFLADWLIDRVVDRLGPLSVEPTARASLVDLLGRENGLDLSLVLSALLRATPQSSTAITAADINRALGEAMAAAERAPENIQEYRAAASRIPNPTARRRLMTEISRLARMGAGADQQMLTTWIETVLAWPWREKPLPLISPDQIPDLVRAAMAKLDQEIYGMKEVKQEIIRVYELYLHQISQGREPDMPIIALSGPPGTAKTHLARMIGDIFGLPSEVIACSGVDDPRHFVGFRRTYTSSEPGSIVKAYRKTKTKRMVLVFDELDKRRMDGHYGDPLNALTRFFDPKHRRFTDDFLELLLEVGQTLSIITVNRLESIPEHLRSRMTILKVEEPTREEKIGMAETILLPRLMKSKGFVPPLGTDASTGWIAPVTIDGASSLITRLVDSHLRPRDDARKIEERLNQLLDTAFGDYIETGHSVRLDANALERYLGPPRGPGARGYASPEEIGRLEIPIQEGALMTVHAVHRPGAAWKLQLPLTLGEQGGSPNTLAETARVAWDLALSTLRQQKPNAIPGTVYLHLDPNDAELDQKGLGFAGLGILVALYSSMAGRAPPPGVCFAGAIDLKRNVLPLNAKDHGTLRRKVARAFAEGNNTFCLPAGDATRRQLETMMSRQPVLRGLIIQNGVAELTLSGDPGPADSSDHNPSAQRRQQEADLWNRLLEGLPAKARGTGVDVEKGQILLEETQGAHVQTVTLRGSERALTDFLAGEERLRSTFRYVLVETVDEALQNFFPNESGPSSPTGGPKSGPSLPPTAEGGSAGFSQPAPTETGRSLSFSQPQPNTVWAAVRILGENEEKGSPLHALDHQLQEANTLPTLEDGLKSRLAGQLRELPPPGPASDISRGEWRDAHAIVGDFVQTGHDSPHPHGHGQDLQQSRTDDYYSPLAKGLAPSEPSAGFILVDWGMVASNPSEVAKILATMTGNSKQTLEIGFLNTEGEGHQMIEALQKTGLGHWQNAHMLDRKGLQEAGALLEGGRVDLQKVNAYVQTDLRRQGRSPAPLTQVVADPLNARRYIGDVVRLLMEVEEVVLQGDPAVALVTTLGHDPARPIRIPTLSYDPLTRTLRLPPHGLPPSALTRFDKILLLVDTQA